MTPREKKNLQQREYYQRNRKKIIAKNKLYRSLAHTDLPQALSIGKTVLHYNFDKTLPIFQNLSHIILMPLICSW